MNNGVILMADGMLKGADLSVSVPRMYGFGSGVVVTRDGMEALDFLSGTGGYTGRDIRVMPRMDRLEALWCIREDERTRLPSLPDLSAVSEERENDPRTAA